MKKLFNLFVLAAVGAMLFVSCNPGSKVDLPKHVRYGTVNMEWMSDGYYFIGDDGETYWPGDVSRIGTYDAMDKDGRRVFFYYNDLKAEKAGYDHNIALYGIVEPVIEDVKTVYSEDDIVAAGDDEVGIEAVGIGAGSWLDIGFVIVTSTDATVDSHKFSLLYNPGDAPADMPESYTYLEFRHKADKQYTSVLGSGHVSFRLNDLAPAITGSKGLYIRYDNGEENYLKVDYKAEE